VVAGRVDEDIPAFVGGAYAEPLVTELAHHGGQPHGCAGNASLIAGGIPAVTAALAVLLLVEPLTLRLVAGIAPAVAGVALISLEGNGAGPPNAALGNLLVFAGVVMWAYYTILGKRMASAGSPPLPPLRQRQLRLFCWLHSPYRSPFPGVPQLAPGSIGSIAYLGAGESAVALDSGTTRFDT
jgi:drug/metabolite transporter (DMT)-like permease